MERPRLRRLGGPEARHAGPVSVLQPSRVRVPRKKKGGRRQDARRRKSEEQHLLLLLGRRSGQARLLLFPSNQARGTER